MDISPNAPTPGPTGAEPRTSELMGQPGPVDPESPSTEVTPIPWDVGRSRLAEARLYWFATTGPSARPHVRPVLAVWADGALHTTTNPEARKGRNLATDPHCAITVTSEGMDLVVEGTASRVRDLERLERVAATYATKYGWPPTVEGEAFDAPYGAPTAGAPPYEVYEIVPEVAFGFGTDESFAPRPTRWRF